jgi:oligoribonuclease NrnB/cAMP/cGMP phosphodiesterase (DHH superfamily)
LELPDVDLTSKNLLVVDFSFKPDVCRKLAERAKSIVIADHHKTAKADLQEFIVPENLTYVTADMYPSSQSILANFDMDRSGARMAWDFCFPGEECPMLVQFVEDRDLWRFKLEGSRAFGLYLRSVPYSFESWDGVYEFMKANPSVLMQQAYCIEQFFDQQIEDMVKTAIFKKIGKWEVPVAYAPYAFTSDLAHQLLKKYPDAPFAAVIVDAYGEQTYSLRSEDGREDVSEVAKQYGGGGHRNASGFRVPS